MGGWMAVRVNGWIEGAEMDGDMEGGWIDGGWEGGWTGVWMRSS